MAAGTGGILRRRPVGSATKFEIEHRRVVKIENATAEERTAEHERRERLFRFVRWCQLHDRFGAHQKSYVDTRPIPFPCMHRKLDPPPEQKFAL